MIPVLVVTGPCGVGKSSVASGIAELLCEQRMPHAVIDMDWTRDCFPSPADDPFHTALGYKNLAGMWQNYHTAGAQWLILVDVVEARADLDHVRAAVPGAKITLVRLRAGVPTLHARLVGREVGQSLVWHKARAAELSAQMDRDALEDVLIDTDGKGVLEIASEVLLKTRWIAS